jgi:hypothetical protein
MAFLDFIRNRDAAPQQSAAQTQQQQEAPQRSVQSLPDNVKAEAVEAARPAADIMNRATTPRTGESQTQPSVQNTPDNSQGRGRSLGMER